MNKSRSWWSAVLAGAALAAGALVLLASCQTMQAAGPKVFAADQVMEHGEVSINRVVSEVPGWLVIHSDVEGAPGPVLGYAPVKAGVNWNVRVKIRSDGSRLWAMLHVDAGMVGTYEFPGPDVPVSVEGKVVMLRFSLRKGYSSGGGMSY
jgi:hypothetical protein